MSTEVINIGIKRCILLSRTLLGSLYSYTCINPRLTISLIRARGSQKKTLARFLLSGEAPHIKFTLTMQECSIH